MKNYDVDSSKSYEELVKDYRRMAKVADQRLVRLEKYSQEENFKTATQWSYARAMKDIQKWSGDESQRFNTKPPANKNSLIAKMKDIETFLESKTSTKKDIVNVYKTRADSINKKYGTKFTWQSMASFYSSKEAEKLNNSYGSKTVLKAIAEIQDKGKKQVQEIQNSDDKHLVVEDALVQPTVNDLLDAEGLNIDMLFK